MEHNHKITIEKTEVTIEKPKEMQFSPATIIAASILVGAILITSSIFYNTSLIVKSLADNKGSANTQQAAAAQTNPSQPAAGAPVSVDIRDGAAVLGNEDAKVTIVEFGDFQCPYCQNFFKNTFPQLKSQYIDTGKVKLVFMHFPLTQIHVNAQIAGVAAECANQQGKFWEYHDLLYTNGKGDGTGLDKASLEKYASQLGLNKVSLPFTGSDKFNKCLESNATLDKVNSDQAEGSKDGVSGTPTFFINGTKLVGAQPLVNFQQAIDAALK